MSTPVLYEGVYAFEFTCHRAYVAVRGQLVGTIFSFYPADFRFPALICQTISLAKMFESSEISDSTRNENKEFQPVLLQWLVGL